MDVSGVSTKKLASMDTLSDKNMYKHYVSSITKLLDEEIPYLITDVLYIKVRENRRVASKAVHIAIGIDSKEFKNSIGFLISDSTSEETWKAFYQPMIDRGLTNVEIVIPDARQGQVNVIRKSLTKFVWQKHQVRFFKK